MNLFIIIFNLLLNFNQAGRWDNKHCKPSYVGDGLCDLQCNTKRWHWDNGDCCPTTCKSNRLHHLDCGKLGYQCLEDIPSWFYDKIELCFKATPKPGSNPPNPEQCGGKDFSRIVCAKPGEYTPAYLDDTNDRKGYCYMRWGLHKNDLFFDYPPWLTNLTLCFRWHQKGGTIACGSALQTPCARISDFTVDYNDNSGDRIGPNNENSCILSWMIKVPEESPEWAKRLSICLKVEATGDEMQCSWTKKDRFCATQNTWTLFYHDGTDEKPGGCLLQWGIFFTGY